MDNLTLSTAKRIAELVRDEGGTAYFVGGCVRDGILGIDSGDADIEVHGIVPDRLRTILDRTCGYAEVGSFFGIFKVRNCDIDVAIPRKEVSTGTKHRDFDISLDPFIGTYAAAKRRDFTCNAMMKNILTGEITDHFGGVEDTKNKILRRVDPVSFVEDPLRVLRAAQFAARFGFSVDPETEHLCASINLSSLSGERVFGELKKGLTMSSAPSVFFELLDRFGQLDFWFGELLPLKNSPQSAPYHLEGNVWNHTMMVLDAASSLKDRAGNPFGFMLSALTHDLGKPLTVSVKNGVIHNYGHETAGLVPTETFLSRLTADKKLKQYVKNLNELHMKPNKEASENVPVKTTNRMFDEAIDPVALIYLAEADNRGKKSSVPFRDNTPFLLERLEIYREYMSRPFVTGKDLVDAGIEPGKDFSSMLALAHRMRLAGVPKDEAMKQILGSRGKHDKKRR